MATESFLLAKHTVAANVYARVFDIAGQVFDFSDNTFKATIGAATTPQTACSEVADVDGTGFSGYTFAVDLDLLNKSGAEKRLLIRYYDNVTPAAADVAIADGDERILVQFGRLGLRDVVAQGEISVKSTAGLAAQVSAWLEHGGRKVPIATVDAAATATVTVREHESGVDLFSLPLTAADLVNDCFEGEQATPAFVDDRQYEVTVAITENGNTHTSTHRRVVLG